MSWDIQTKREKAIWATDDDNYFTLVAIIDLFMRDSSSWLMIYFNPLSMSTQRLKLMSPDSVIPSAKFGTPSSTREGILDQIIADIKFQCINLFHIPGCSKFIFVFHCTQSKRESIVSFLWCTLQLWGLRSPRSRIRGLRHDSFCDSCHEFM
jgi:hypothetical protein